MIKTSNDLKRFIEENQQGDWIVHIVPTIENIHPVVSNPSVIFIRNILTSKTYYYAFDHPDSEPSIDNLDFEECLCRFKNKKWTLDKKSFSQMVWFVEKNTIFDINLISYLKENTTTELSEYYTPIHHLINRNIVDYSKTNLAIPLLKHKEMFDNFADDITLIIKDYVIDDSFIKFNNLIGTLGKLELQGIFVDRQEFLEKFNVDVGPPGMVFSQYNCYTSTGRPGNKYNNINYAALNHNDGSRACFCSRYHEKGKMVLIDYTSFHPRIICKLTNYDIPIETDIYEYLAKLYFQKKEVDETDIKNSKQLTFKQLYGGVEEKYEHIKYLSNLKTYINKQWDFFQNNEYVLTPIFKRKITSKHILDPNPTKVFNYILQATEGEIAIPRIELILNYLSQNNKKTRSVLYTYDSVLYDFHKDDEYETLKEIRNIMSCNNMFPMKTYVGDNYQDIKLVNF